MDFQFTFVPVLLRGKLPSAVKFHVIDKFLFCVKTY